MRAVFTMARKDFALMLRDGFAMFWILAFPIVYALFFGAIFGDTGGGGRGAMSLALVDDDRSEQSTALLERLADHESISVWRDSEDAGGGITLSTLEQARDLVRKGKRTAYLRIPEGYGAEPWAMFAAQAGDADAPTLELGVDPSRQAEAGMLQGVLMEVVFSGMGERFGDRDALLADVRRGRDAVIAEPDLSASQRLVLQTFFGALEGFLADVDPELLEGGMGVEGGAMGSPVQLVDVDRDRSGQPASAWDITFPQSMVWGLMSVAMTFAIMIVRERLAGTLLRLQVAPVTRTQIMAGKALGCFFACMMVMGVVLLLGSVALGLRIASPGLLLLAMVCTAACFTGIMMSVAVLGRSENAVAGASWGLMMPFAMIGGGMIPLIAMPSWMLTASNASPFKWAITSLEGAIWRDFSLAEMALPCGVLLGTGALFFGLGATIFRRMDA